MKGKRDERQELVKRLDDAKEKVRTSPGIKAPHSEAGEAAARAHTLQQRMAEAADARSDLANHDAEKQARTTKWQTWIAVAAAVLGAVFTGVYTWITSRQFAVDSRPYVALGDATFGMQENAPGSGQAADATEFVNVKMQVLNVGKVPVKHRLVAATFNGKDPDSLDRSEAVLFPGRSSERWSYFHIPLTKVAALTGSTGKIRIEYHRLGEDATYYYVREFHLDVQNRRVDFTTEDAN
jgi:hypothetical protein